jgi:REP element-mobilizing transposase RayT
VGNTRFEGERVPAYDPALHHRRSIRLHGYDYRSSGVYFVTICTMSRQCRFGDVVDATVALSAVGRVVDETWQWLAAHHDYVDVGPYIVMPNHLHGIIMLAPDEGGSRTAPTAPAVTPRKPVGRLIGAFKTVSTKRVNEVLGTPGDALWQRNYWEHIVRDDESLGRIADYIVNNPITWESDQLFMAKGRTP